MKACNDKQGNYNFFAPYICTINGSVWLTVPGIFLVIYVIFKFIAALVDEYICPSIEYIKEVLEMSEALAGVTLLALANGAGDVITAIVASGSADGVSYNIGALFGAGFFVVSMVICLTIKKAETDIIVDPSTIYRDVGFYILGSALCLFYAIWGQIPWWGAMSMLILYALLVVVTYIQDKMASSASAGADDGDEKKVPLLGAESGGDNKNKDNKYNLNLTPE